LTAAKIARFGSRAGALELGIPTHTEVLSAGLSRPGLSAPSDLVTASPFTVRASSESRRPAVVTRPRVLPVPAKGFWALRWLRLQVRDQTLSWVVRGVRCGEGAMQTPARWGEGCASTSASRRGGTPALRSGVLSRGQNRTRESDRPGSKGGVEKRDHLGAWGKARSESDGTAAGPCGGPGSLDNRFGPWAVCGSNCTAQARAISGSLTG